MRIIDASDIPAINDILSSAETESAVSEATDVTSSALDLSCFAYLSLPHKPNGKPHLISTYPVRWTTHYMQNHYHRINPVDRWETGKMGSRGPRGAARHCRSRSFRARSQFVQTPPNTLS
ncbi:autoinducer binding domain-containing protein [Bradyrhizobium sp. NP1]|uniref:autoinducer binding domain-containing protein n=1 Tax=Bradyrhizobium sp. NP1 TaxID=3049772 RepID=UPI0025A5EBFD|nr:autoinducer binding domain-containing protein [Bradyrhizobium sp. NP1]WJR75852.1 autoinducer binding domain-containing protein [Bradyrhizobium sp. NP1]